MQPGKLLVPVVLPGVRDEGVAMAERGMLRPGGDGPVEHLMPGLQIVFIVFLEVEVPGIEATERQHDKLLLRHLERLRDADAAAAE